MCDCNGRTPAEVHLESGSVKGEDEEESLPDVKMWDHLENSIASPSTMLDSPQTVNLKQVKANVQTKLSESVVESAVERDLLTRVNNSARGIHADLEGTFRHSAVIAQFLEREPPEDAWLWKIRWRIGHVMDSVYMQFLILAFIVFNGILLAFEADEVVSDGVADVFHIVLSVVFNVEISLRLFAYGLRLYLSDSYNWLDLFCVLSADLLGLFSGFISDNVDPLPMILRMFKLFRLARLTYMLRQLETIINAFISGMAASVWALILVMFCIYCGAIVMTFWLKKHPSLPVEVRSKYWGSMGNSMVTLTEIMTLEWKDSVQETGSALPAAYPVLMAFLVFAGIGVMNLFGAIFVDSLLNARSEAERVLRKTQKQAREELQKDMYVMMASADVDNTGTLDTGELRMLFAFLDEDDKGIDGIDEETPDVAAFRQGIMEKKKILGLERSSFKAAIDFVSNNMTQSKDKEVLFGAIVKAFFQMDDAATRRDVMLASATLETGQTGLQEALMTRIDALDSQQQLMLGTLVQNQTKMIGMMEDIITRL